MAASADPVRSGEPVLSLAERLIRVAVRNGAEADLTSLPAVDRTVSATMLVELLLAEQTSDAERLDPRGVRVRGARITGTLDLEHCTCRVPLILTSCTFTAVPILRHATLPALAFRDCDLPGLNAIGIHLEHGLDLSRCRATGLVALVDAKIGTLDCSGATLTNEGGYALIAQGAEISGNVFLRLWDDGCGNQTLCKITGAVWLTGARITGPLDCSGATLTNEGGNALSAQGAEIAGGVLLRAWNDGSGSQPVPCEIRGAVRLSRVRITGPLDCSGATLTNPGGEALDAQGAEISGSVFLRAWGSGEKDPVPCQIYGRVSLAGARIAGPLDCSGATVINPGGEALIAAAAEITSVLLRAWDTRENEPVRCQIHGLVSLAGARIAGPMDCTGAILTNPGGIALRAAHGEITGPVILAPWNSHYGPSRLPCQINGEVDLVGARIDSGLCIGAEIIGSVDLSLCSASELVDDLALSEDGRLTGCWSQVEQLRLDGFRYDRFATGATWDHRARFAWLRRTTDYSPSAWEQLQRVYTQNGHEDEARVTAIAKQKDRLRRGHLTPAQKAWMRLLGVTIGYGYRPARAGLWALAAIAILTTLTWIGRHNLTYTGPPPTTTLDLWTAFAYAADTFIPVADFNTSDNWQTRGWLEPIRFAFIALGWLLVSLFIAGLTRILRN